jgi:hypothetical protein
LVLVPPATELDLGDIPLMPLQKLECIVRDPDGQAIHCVLHTLPLDPLPHPALRSHRRSAHHYQSLSEPIVVRLPPGRYLFQVVAQGGLVASQVVDTRTLSDGTLRFQLAGGCRLRLLIDAEETSARLEVRNDSGQPLIELDLRGRETHDNYFPVGNYVMTLRHLDGRVTTRAVQLGPDGLTLKVP